MNFFSNIFPPIESKIKLVVCVVTYNQKKFISECLQSLVDQVVDFPFEIIVGDDCSTDGTSEIVANFAAKYPDRIIHVRHSQNVGAYQNYMFVHRRAQDRGEYIAHVDGDDYVLPGKLEAQVRILDLNPSVSLAAHAAEIIGLERFIGNAEDLPVRGGINDLVIRGTYFINSSTMYRASNAFVCKDDEEVVDFHVHLHHAAFGEIYLDKTIYGAYRWHPEGVSKNPAYRDRIYRAYERAFELARNLGVPGELVNRGRLIRLKSFALSQLVAGDRIGFRRSIRLPLSDWKYASWNHKFLSLSRHFIRGKVARMLVKRVSG